MNEPMTDAEWREWVAEAEDGELEEMVRNWRTKSAMDCQDELDRRNEAAHERSLEDYYGGSGPQTDREHNEALAREGVRRWTTATTAGSL